MRTVELDGGTVTLRERQDVKVRQRQMLEAASVVAAPAIEKIPRKDGSKDEIDWERLDRAGLSLDEMQSLLQLQNAAIVAFVASWTFDEPTPRSVDDVLDMPADRYEALSHAVRGVGAAILTGDTNFEPSDPKAPGFADTPTQGSTGSVPSSPATPASSSGTATEGSTDSGKSFSSVG